MNKRSMGAYLCFGVAIVTGAVLGRTSWNGAIYLSSTSFTTHMRTPAAVHRDLESVKLADAQLLVSGKERLVSEARILMKKKERRGQMGLEFGHFVTRDEMGNKQLACEFYDRMRVRFVAEGVATAGEKPTMEIEGPCKTGGDITKIEPVWIPVSKILAETPSDMELSFPQEEGLAFKFSNMDADWPTRWTMSSVQLFNSAEVSRRGVTFAGPDLRSLREKPLVLAWPRMERMPTAEN